MGITKPTIVLYSHTDYFDVCNVFFGQSEKYLKEYKKILLINEKLEDIPNSYNTILYDEKLPYRERLISSLEQIDDELILFLHEDMFLFGPPKHNIINEFSKLVSNGSADMIKLIKAGDNLKKTEIHNNLVMSPSDNMFSIQPTITKRNTLINLLKKTNANTIYEIEYSVSNICIEMGLKCFMSQSNEDILRGMFHWDSIIFPYVATAIVKGKWNYLEYQKELSEILKEYDVNENKRGCFTSH
jgi:hypothetical protein